MDKSKGKFFKLQKKKVIAPVFISEGINKKFLLAVNDHLFILLSENKRKEYIDKYSAVQEPLGYLSPQYFASAIAFWDINKEGPNEDNFNNSTVNKYVNLSSNSAIPQPVLNLRRKIELLRYIRLLEKINETLP